jgi:hypothetical protein
VSRNRAAIPHYDYTPLMTDTMTNNPKILTAIMVSHCKICYTTFTAVSHSPKGATKLIRQKFRDHVKDGVCEQKEDRLAKQIPAKTSRSIRTETQIEESRDIRSAHA